MLPPTTFRWWISAPDKNLMKFKALVSLTVLVATLLIGSVSFASITTNQAAIGGIGIHASMDYVRSIYGEPDSITHKRSDGMNFDEIKYGNSVVIRILKGKILTMSVTANNGWATPDSVTVGMSEMVLNDVYGPANFVDKYNGETIYEYGTTPHGPAILTFIVKKGIITAITIGFGG